MYLTHRVLAPACLLRYTNTEFSLSLSTSLRVNFVLIRVREAYFVRYTNTMEPFAIPRAVITNLKEKAESLYQHGSSSLWLSRYSPLPRVEPRRPTVYWNEYWKLTHLQPWHISRCVIVSS